MKKQFLNALLCGAMLLPTGVFVSCSDDHDDLEDRLVVVEGYLADIKATLSNALVTGASIISASQNADGGWTLKLSDGSTITIKGATTTSSGGGSSITVEPGAGYFKITVDGTEYTIPTGAAVNSLVYVPEYTDGKVVLGNDGASVKFLATPAISADDLNGAEISIADAAELQTRGGSNLFKVTDKAIDGDYVKVGIKGIDAVAGKTYTVAIKLEISGSSISSNYFTVEVASDFSFVSEDLVTPTFGEAITDAAQLDGGFWVATLPDGTGEKPYFLSEFKFSDFVSIPETRAGEVVYELAAADKQNGNVQAHYDVLKNSLSADGTWKLAGRPGTDCSGDETQPGLLVLLKVDDVTKAKVYWKIVDPIKDADFTGGRTGNFEAEWGGSEKYLECGAQEVDIPKILANWETEIPTIHGGKDNWFALWNDYSVANAADDMIIFNDGGKLTVTEFGQKYCSNSRGVYWFFRGFAIYVPQSLATDGKYVDENDKEYSGGEGFGYDFWLGQYNEYINDPVAFYSRIASWNVTMDEATGKLKLPDTYTGWGMRIAVDGGFEYDYGVKPIHGANSDQCGMLFFNRRVAPTDAKMPAGKKD